MNVASQPARAVASFCRLQNFDHELKMVDMRKGAHRKEPYMSVNPTKQIPALQELDPVTNKVVFQMGESHAILRYLADSRKVADHWYPADLKKRAAVDMYLDQHHSYLRQGVGGFIFKKLFSPGMTGRVFQDHELDFHRIMLKRSLRLIEGRLSKTPFLCGDEMTIADLSAACELDQVHFVDLKLDKWPNTKLWLHKMIDE